MREIKFRAWSKFPKMFLDMSDACYYLLPFGKLVQITCDKRNRAIHREIDAVVQLYTGVKDCKGREIYEGDIIEFALSLFESVKGSIEFDYGTFYLKPTDKKYDNLLLANMNFDLVEVIGNIYENPELIGGKNERFCNF